jgi:hypothetical protein
VTSIEEQLVRRAQARSGARKVKLSTRKAAKDFIRAFASTGRRAVVDETGPHPFRLPPQKSATVVLATARLFLEEAERRKEKFVELGMPPTFLTDYAKAVDDLANAIGVQQDSRGARRKAQGAIEAALAQGSRIVADLDVTVPNALRGDTSRLAEWAGARRMDHQSSPREANADTQTTEAVSNRSAVVETATERKPPAGPADAILKTAA